MPHLDIRGDPRRPRVAPRRRPHALPRHSILGRAGDSVNSSAAAEMHEGLDVFERHAAADTQKYATD